MDISQQFKTDQKLELEGTWVPVDAKTKLKVARAENQNYFNALNRLIKENGFSHAARSGKIPAEVTRNFILTAVAETVLVGWEGLTDHGKPIKYSAKEAERMFTEAPDFLAYVLSLANDITNFQVAVEAEVIKN